MKWHLAARLAVLFFVTGAYAQTPVFTYQGRLNSSGSPATGQYEMRFTLHDAFISGAQVAGPLTNSPVGVTNGLFTTSLNFGSLIFDGSARWLQIGVRGLGETNDFTTLTPRQQLTSTPYAIRAATASAAIALTAPLGTTNLAGVVALSNLPPVALLTSNANFAGSVSATVFLGPVPGSNVVGKVSDVVLSTNVAFLNTDANFKASVIASNFFGDGIGLTNVPGRIFQVIPTATNIQALANFGYLATNNLAAVVVTLPDSPNIRIGETIRVTASGAGGWVIAQNAGQSVMMGNLLNTFVPNFASRGISAVYNGVACSADGKRMFATSTAGVYTSQDYGATWSLRGGSPSAKCIASSADGVKLVAGVSTGFIYTSIDSGTNWTSHNPSVAWSSVASSLDGVKLAGASSGSGNIYTSVDSGGTWPLRIGTANITGIASSADGTRLVASLNTGGLQVSADSGITWAVRDSSRAWSAVACSADGSRMVASVNGGMLYYSTDYGTNWTATETSRAWTSLASSADGSKLAATIGSATVYFSTDSGITWFPRTTSLSGSASGVTMSSDGSTVAVVGPSSFVQVSSQSTSTVGVTGGLVGSRLAAVELEYVGGGVFIPISYVGTIRAK